MERALDERDLNELCIFMRSEGKCGVFKRRSNGADMHLHNYKLELGRARVDAVHNIVEPYPGQECKIIDVNPLVLKITEPCRIAWIQTKKEHKVRQALESVGLYPKDLDVVTVSKDLGHLPDYTIDVLVDITSMLNKSIEESYKDESSCKSLEDKLTAIFDSNLARYVILCGIDEGRKVEVKFNRETNRLDMYVDGLPVHMHMNKYLEFNANAIKLHNTTLFK